MAALEHAHPGLLEQVLCQRGVAGEKEQIAIEPLLVLLNQPVEHIRIATAQSQGQQLRVFGHVAREE